MVFSIKGDDARERWYRTGGEAAAGGAEGRGGGRSSRPLAPTSCPSHASGRASSSCRVSGPRVGRSRSSGLQSNLRRAIITGGERFLVCLLGGTGRVPPTHLCLWQPVADRR